MRLSSGTGAFGIEPGLAGELRASAAAAAMRLEATASVAALVTRPELRELAAQLLRPVRPRIWVFSYSADPAGEADKGRRAARPPAGKPSDGD